MRYERGPKGPCAGKNAIFLTQVQRVLREEIVNPLRKNLYVSADNVMKLRRLLDRLSSVSGLTSEEKDPEEFLNSLLAQILKAEPFLKLNSGQVSFSAPPLARQCKSLLPDRVSLSAVCGKRRAAHAAHGPAALRAELPHQRH